jgi:uncharacterized protein
MTSALSQVLVKPAGADCNLRCEYCFYLEKAALYPSSRRRMSARVLDALVRQMMTGGAPAVAFGWQGGEPTLMGLEFFRQAVRAQRRHGTPGQLVSNSLQTNGVLVDDGWARFLAEHRFLVGLSIDGPETLHDAHRTTRRGDGSWSMACRAAATLLEHGVEANALVLLSSASAGRVREIWEALEGLGLRHFQFIPCLEWDRGEPGRWAPYALSPADYGEILCELLDLWLAGFENGVPGTYVRWFEALLFRYVGLEPPLCSLREVCGSELVVEHNGDVYSCDFHVTDRWRLGNVLTDDLATLLDGSRQREFGERKRTLPAKCGACRWLSRCRGGCPKDRDRNPEDPGGLNPYCPAYKRVFEKADPHLRRIAEEWKRRTAPLEVDRP